jgi:glucan phosphoethanolaminetransferase (alkaline phosphatase superfamily)
MIFTSSNGILLRLPYTPNTPMLQTHTTLHSEAGKYDLPTVCVFMRHFCWMGRLKIYYNMFYFLYVLVYSINNIYIVFSYFSLMKWVEPECLLCTSSVSVSLISYTCTHKHKLIHTVTHTNPNPRTHTWTEFQFLLW